MTDGRHAETMQDWESRSIQLLLPPPPVELKELKPIGGGDEMAVKEKGPFLLEKQLPSQGGQADPSDL